MGREVYSIQIYVTKTAGKQNIARVEQSFEKSYESFYNVYDLTEKAI